MLSLWILSIDWFLREHLYFLIPGTAISLLVPTASVSRGIVCHCSPALLKRPRSMVVISGFSRSYENHLQNKAKCPIVYVPGFCAVDWSKLVPQIRRTELSLISARKPEGPRGGVSAPCRSLISWTRARNTDSEQRLGPKTLFVPKFQSAYEPTSANIYAFNALQGKRKRCPRVLGLPDIQCQCRPNYSAHARCRLGDFIPRAGMDAAPANKAK